MVHVILACLWLVLQGTSLSNGLIEGRMSYLDMQNYYHHHCHRPCGDKPRVCEYDFLVEYYYTMSRACFDCPLVRSDCFRPHCVFADGKPRGVIVVNRMMPGPPINVCENDTIRVRVHNRLENEEGVAIHWHGIHQLGTPYMDGVPMVTQCVITRHTSFTYNFKASPAGTHFWHAHSGLQRSDGFFGSLVVRQSPRREVHIGQYDHDLCQHTVLLNDWWGSLGAPAFADNQHNNGSFLPTTLLINGKGANIEYPDVVSGHNITTPREEFNVRYGRKYRFRVIGAIFLSNPIRLSIDDHMIKVIASDGKPMEPVEVESLTIFPGERYDFVLTADRPCSTYLIRAIGLRFNSEGRDGAFQTALLHYVSAPLDRRLNSPFPELHGKELNPMNLKRSDTKMFVSDLRSLDDDDDVTLTREPDKKFTLSMEASIINNPRFYNPKYYTIAQTKKYEYTTASLQINFITHFAPPSPLMSQFQDIPQDLFCNAENITKDCRVEFCDCVHLVKVDLDDVVEILLIDEGQTWSIAHSVHLHGHTFRVLAMEKLGFSVATSLVEEMDAAGNITRNFDRPPIKDSVVTPDGGYTILRFHANNPGFWFLHCHDLFHAVNGMGMIFQVGDLSQFPPVPPKFPTCGSWSEYE